MKKLISILLSIIMLISCVSAVQFTASAADYKSLSTDLPLNGQWSGEYWLTASIKEKWFRITIPSDGKLTIKTMAYFGCCYMECYNYDLTNQFISDHLHGNETTPETSSSERVLSQGTYYIKVSGDLGKYKLCTSFVSYNANDYGANSYDQPLILLSNNTITGVITETDREDWYKIQIPNSGRYNIRLTARFGCCYLSFYDYDLTNQISEGHLHGNELTPETETYNIVVSQGTYYIKISGDSGWYNLSWSALTPENCSHDFSSSTVYSTYVAKGYTQYVCKNCGYSYKANYTSKNKLSKPTIYSNKNTRGLKKALKINYSYVYNATGYQIQYSTDKKFKKKVKTIRTKNTSKTIKKLKGKKKYYVRVRAYIKQNGKTAYSSWSSKKAIKTK